MYIALEGRPMNIRFLDPPLHEFLPTKAEDIAEIAAELNITLRRPAGVIESRTSLTR
jgi:pyruvate,orthophosphate dikinase